MSDLASRAHDGRAGESSLQPSADFDDLVLGQCFRSGGRAVSEAEVIAFCTLTGDWHPVHHDPEWAARSIFGERVAHGMLILSLAVGLVPLDPARVLALRRVSDVVFKRPVRLGDVIDVEATLTGRRPLDERLGLVELRWRIRNQDGALVCRADVLVLWRRGATDTPAASLGLGL